MRIGVLTYHWVYNFGANLQALATCRFLTHAGHEVWILNYRPQELVDLYASRVLPAQAEVHEHFCDTYLPQSPVCRSEDELVQFCNAAKLDVVLTGSDAVFRLSPKLNREDTRFPNPFWLEWVSKRLRPAPLAASLAASAMGTNYYSFPFSLRQKIGAAIRNLRKVSVRDRWTQLMVMGVTWGLCRPPLCPDPIVILEDVFQIPETYAAEPSAKRRQYILLSMYEGMLTPDWIAEFVSAAHNEGLEVYGFPLPDSPTSLPVDRELHLPLSPFEWYSWISNAAGFVGARFHALLCSMMGAVPFLAFDTYQSGSLRLSSKSYDLCSRAHMRSACLDWKQRRELSPQTALTLLRASNTDPATKYVERAKQDFSRVATSLLAP
jgi:hypothetical protein